MKRYRTSYTVEMLVGNIISDFANEYDLEDNFYGDCYPMEILELERSMLYMTEEELEEAIEELKKDLKVWYL